MNEKQVHEGMTLLQAGDLHAAELRFRAALTHNARDAQALLGLGIVAHQTGHFAQALDLFDRCLAVMPSLAAVHVNRGNTLMALQQYAAALDAFEAALSYAPDLPSALINMAGAFNALGRIDDAVAVLERARAVQPDSAELLNNLGNFLKDQGRLAEARACYERALELNPLMQQAFSNRLALLKLDPALTPAQILVQHRQWSNWFEAVSRYAPLLLNSPEPSRKLRVGYVSPDCHTAVPAFLYPVIAAHHREHFEIFCYFNNPQQPEKLKALGIADTARVMRGLSDQHVAEWIHRDAIDILVDIAGHTGHNRLGVFARRPAPVQMTWLDYLCTTGLQAMDYRITDRVADPQGHEAFHGEKLLYLPQTAMVLAARCQRAGGRAPACDAARSYYIWFLQQCAKTDGCHTTVVGTFAGNHSRCDIAYRRHCRGPDAHPHTGRARLRCIADRIFSAHERGRLSGRLCRGRYCPRPHAVFRRDHYT